MLVDCIAARNRGIRQVARVPRKVPFRKSQNYGYGALRTPNSRYLDVAERPRAACNKVMAFRCTYFSPSERTKCISIRRSECTISKERARKI